MRIVPALLLLPMLFGGGKAPCSGGSPYADIRVAQVLRVIDGDTFVCDLDEHSAIADRNIPVRLRGIDTPELRSPDPMLRAAARQERERLAELLRNARVIELRNPGRDKYFRIDAEVWIDGEPLLRQLNPDYRSPAR